MALTALTDLTGKKIQCSWQHFWHRFTRQENPLKQNQAPTKIIEKNSKFYHQSWGFFFFLFRIKDLLCLMYRKYIKNVSSSKGLAPPKICSQRKLQIRESCHQAELGAARFADQVIHYHLSEWLDKWMHRKICWCWPMSSNFCVLICTIGSSPIINIHFFSKSLSLFSFCK